MSVWCQGFAFIAQLAEHALSKRKVTSSILVEGSLIRYGVVGNISACHADAQGSIPCFGVFFFIMFTILFSFLGVYRDSGLAFDTLPEWLRGSPAK